MLRRPVRTTALVTRLVGEVVGAPALVDDRGSIPGARPTVLVAEDNEVNQRVAAAMLERSGYACDFAEDGLEAVQKARERTYAAILMDCDMPRLDGYDATEAIRKAERGRRVPIIAMTASAGAEDRARCFRVGMDAYLSKPARARQLKDTLSDLLQ